MTNQNVMVKTYLKKSIYITNLEERKRILVQYIIIKKRKIYNNIENECWKSIQKTKVINICFAYSTCAITWCPAFYFAFKLCEGS